MALLRMFVQKANKFFLLIALLFAAVAVQGQIPPVGDPSPIPSRDPMSQPRNIRETMAKFKAEKSKKEHAELIKRGEEAVELSQQLKSAIESGGQLTSADREKLESLEKLVGRIRKDLGGSDKGSDEEGSETESRRPQTIEDDIRDLWAVTVQLGKELKKTTRFTVSAVAIETSNSVLRLVKFLRLRK